MKNVLRPKLFLLAALPVMATALAWFWLRPRLDPVPFSGPVESHFLGSVSFDLPAGFRVESGRLQLICQGSPSLIRIREIPHPPLEQAAQLAALIPAESPPANLVEAEADFGRPALWAFVPAGPDEVMAHLALGFKSGAVVMSRLFPADRLAEEQPAFTAEARRFAEKYAWGHEGAGPGDRHSLHGHLRLDQGCRRLRGSIKFTAPEADLEVFWPGVPPPAAWPGEPEAIPGRRLLRAEPRPLDDRPGREWVALPGGPESPDRAALTAAWRPEAEDEAVFFLSAPYSSAAEALGYWEAILASVRFIRPELEGPGAVLEAPPGPAAEGGVAPVIVDPFAAPFAAPGAEGWNEPAPALIADKPETKPETRGAESAAGGEEAAVSGPGQVPSLEPDQVLSFEVDLDLEDDEFIGQPEALPETPPKSRSEGRSREEQEEWTSLGLDFLPEGVRLEGGSPEDFVDGE